uniref:Uncharacterized protein n=1 Tax=Anabas testudineus TaxID=64144 RepID=A0A7N6BJQ5_ANATE
MHTTTQKAVSSKQSAQSVITDKVQTSITDVAKTANMNADGKKDSKNQTTKGLSKSEQKNGGETCSDKVPVKIVQSDITVIAERNVKSSKSQSGNNKMKDNTAAELSNNKKSVASDKNAKESKSPQRENKKKTDQSPTKSQEKASDQSIQTEKAAAHTNGKTSKPNQKVKKNNKQEKQVETTVSYESVSQVLRVDMEEKVKVLTEPTEAKTELKQEVKKVTPSLAASSATAVPVSITDSQPETPTPAKKKKKSKKSKGGAQPSQGKDISAESKTDAVETKTETSENSHQTQEAISDAQMQKIHVKREVISTESKEDQNSQQQKAVQKHVKAPQKKKGVTVIQQSAEEPPAESVDVPITVTGELEQNELVKSITRRTEESHITKIQRVSEKTDFKSVKTLLNTGPDWLVSPETKCELEGSVVESDEHKNEVILSHMRKLAEDKLTHLETVETKEKHECEPFSEKGISGGATPRISKISIGSAKIESQMKTNTSQERRKEETTQFKSVDLRAPSPSLRMRSPSPTFITIESTRRTDSPHRVTPSPTLLHRPPTPPTPPPRRCDTPTSRLSRITPSPTFDRAENLARLKDTTAKLSRGVTPPPLLSPQHISEKKSEIVESPASFHRQIKIETVVETLGTLLPTEKLGLNANEMCHNDPDFREFFEEAQKAEINKTYLQKKPIAVPEQLGPDMEECEVGNKNKENYELPKASMSSLANKFESAEEKIYKRKELIPFTDLQQSAPLPPLKRKVETVPAQPTAFSETISITEHFSNVDRFGSEVRGTRAAVTEHSESVSTQQTPFSYADAVKRKAKRYSSLLRFAAAQRKCFSHGVMKKLFAFYLFQTGSSSEVRAVHSMSEKSLSDGCSDSGQKKVP